MGNVHSWCMELAFKVVTGGPFGVYDLFVRNRTHNTKNRAAQQLTNQVKEHYKSDVLNDIHSYGVTKIRVSYYKGGAEAQYFVFNAVGATKTGWFSRDRLLETSFNNITTLTDIRPRKLLDSRDFNFGVDYKNPVSRRFFINEGYYECGGDLGWVVVIDGPGPCSMDKGKTSTISVDFCPRGTMKYTSFRGFCPLDTHKGYALDPLGEKAKEAANVGIRILLIYILGESDF
uniref:Uncharacterized protein n=1 Tax=Magallana gigas TaxID=29159 RepID=K1PBB8_MAGGI